MSIIEGLIRRTGPRQWKGENLLGNQGKLRYQTIFTIMKRKYHPERHARSVFWDEGLQNTNMTRETKRR